MRTFTTNCRRGAPRPRPAVQHLRRLRLTTAESTSASAGVAVPADPEDTRSRRRHSNVYLGDPGAASGSLPMSDERGYTLIELLVGMMVSLVVLAAILAMVQVATGNQDRVAEHVYANQRGRPVMNADRRPAALGLRLAGPGAGAGRQRRELDDPLLEERRGRQPDARQVRRSASSGGTLTETVYPGTRRRTGRTGPSARPPDRAARSTASAPPRSANRPRPCRSSATSPTKAARSRRPRWRRR